MAKVIAYWNGDKVGIFIPAFEFDLNDYAIKNFQSFIIIDDSQIPQDKTFRNSWVLGSGIEVDIYSAKNEWKNKWRDARKPKLAALDVEFIRAVELGDKAKQSEISSKKQALRDVTLTEIPGTTPEEIKSVWPEVLNDTV